MSSWRRRPERTVPAALPVSPLPRASVITGKGAELDAHNVRHTFRKAVAKAGLGPFAWTRRELRHSFVSLLSANGVRIEDSSRLVAHSASDVTERVYRHQLHAVFDEGATVMDDLFPLK